MSKKQWNFNFGKAILFTAIIAVPVFVKAQAKGSHADPMVGMLIVGIVFVVFGFLDSFIGE